jgi:5'-3' exonuclease
MNLIIDGNYILYRNVFSLHKSRILYGALEDSLKSSLKTYSNYYNFNKIFFVSDSSSNWRKTIYNEYKKNRSKDSSIDWDFVRTVYNEFKENLPARYVLCEKDLLEGDDWINYLVKKYNEEGQSNLIITNDGDIKQLVYTYKDTINLILNENFRYDNAYVPDNYREWLSDYIKKAPVPDLFDDTEDKYKKLYDFIKNIINTRNIITIDHYQIIFNKIMAGDSGDNIKGVYSRIGEKTAEKMYTKYLDYYGIPKFNKECMEHMTTLVLETKKLDFSEYDNILEKIKFNDRLVNLDKIPDTYKKLLENG